MKVNAYDNEKCNNLVFETEFDIPNPISNILIEKGLKKAPENYYDNSFEGLELRLGVKTTSEDINTFISNLDNLDLTSDLSDLVINLEKGKTVKFDIDLFEEFSESSYSFFTDFYDNIYDEFKHELDDVKFFEVNL